MKQIAPPPDPSEREEAAAIEADKQRETKRALHGAQKKLSTESKGDAKAQPKPQKRQKDLFDAEDADEARGSAGQTVAEMRGLVRPVRLGSLENERWMSIRKAADAVLHQTFASGLERHGIAYRASESGVEIAAYSREHILAFSDGLKSVQRTLEARGTSLEAASGRAKEMANLASRSQTKRVVPLGAIRRMWLARAEAAGFPVFEPGDTRLAQKGPQRIVMTPGDAVSAALAKAKEGGKRFHSEFALMRDAILASSYGTPCGDIEREVMRQMQSGNLVQTEDGIMRRPDAAAVAKRVMTHKHIERREALAATLRRPGTATDHTPRLASPLSSAQRNALASAVSAGRGVLTLDSPAAVLAASSGLSDSAAESGLRTVFVSPVASPGADGSVSYAAGVAAAGSLDAGTLVVLSGSAEHADEAQLIRTAALRCGAACIELECAQRQPVAGAQPTHVQPSHSPQAVETGASKLARLGALVERHGASLRSAVSVLRGERQSRAEASVPRRSLKQ